MRALFSSVVVLIASVSYVAWQALSGGTARAGTAAPMPTQPTPAPTRGVAATTAPAQPTAVPAQPTVAPAQPTVAPAQPAPVQPVQGQPAAPAPVQSQPQAQAQPAQAQGAPAQPTRVPATAVPTRAPATAVPTTAPAPAAASGGLRDGTWSSAVVPTNWGNIEIEITVAGGRISDVIALQYPQSRSRSLQISRYALPIYEEQVVSTQAARINSVSGATQTARGFQQAVQTAIQKAS